MQTNVIFGRPCSGKTKYIIDFLNGWSGKSLFVNVETSEAFIRKRGLTSSVVIDSLDKMTLHGIIDAVKDSGATAVAIDYLELLPEEVDLRSLNKALESIGVKQVMIAAQLRYQDLKPVSAKRLEGIEYTEMVLGGGG